MLKKITTTPVMIKPNGDSTNKIRDAALAPSLSLRGG
jgi:hypothetical protein